MNIEDAFKTIQSFSSNEKLTRRIGEIELDLKNKKCDTVIEYLKKESIVGDGLEAALKIKEMAGQINVIIHALGVLVSLERICDPKEEIKSLSLGAGNTGKAFDLETDKRIAEFKFINWQGGPEAIRQNSVFKDFFYLAEYDESDPRGRYLYVLDSQYPLRFLRGNRSIQSAVSRNRKLSDDFYNKYGERYSVVSEYYREKQNLVQIVDLQKIVPCFGSGAR